MLSRCLMTSILPLMTICQVYEAASELPGYCEDHGYTPSNGFRKPEANAGYKYFNGSVIRYFCPPSYTLNTSSAVQTCVSSNGKDYRWKPVTLPTCIQVQEKSCSLPQKIEHGSFKISHLVRYTSIDPGTKIYYFCNTNYHLEPEDLQYRECRHGKWTGSNPKCVADGCTPPDGRFYRPMQDFYKIGDTVTYVCPTGEDVVSTCQANHTWSSERCHQLSTDQMPSFPLEYYCKIPQPSIINGDIKCCLDSPASQVNSTSDPSYCCPERGLVEFTCNEGYTLKGAPNQWICGSYGDWLSLDPDTYGLPYESPKCFSNNTREDATSVSDTTLKQVFGVAAGVLVILSAVIIFALCRPKLINMKRRWRELRDDEDELIIDGRRIVLPSYEEATTSRDLCFLEEPCSSSQSDNNPRSANSERQSNVSESRTESSLVSTSTTNLCEDVILVENSSHTNNDNDDVNSSAQSLILTAGTSLDASVMINSPPQNICHINDLDVDTSHGNEYGRRNSDDDDLLVLDSDPECNLDTIYPTSLGSSINQRPACTDSEHNLLKYHLRPIDYATNDFIEPQSFSVIIGPSSFTSTCDDDHGVQQDILEPTSRCNGEVQNCDESCHAEDTCDSLVDSTDHMHLKLSSPTTTQETEKLGSTEV